MKIDLKVYCSMLDIVVEPFKDILFESYKWRCQKNSAPRPQCKANANLVKRTCSRFYHVERMGPVASVDFKPVGLTSCGSDLRLPTKVTTQPDLF